MIKENEELFNSILCSKESESKKARMLADGLEKGLWTQSEMMLRLKTKKYREDTAFYCEECLKIRDKSGSIVPLVPNKHQLKLIGMVERWKEDYPNESKRPTLFIMILKARQTGFSTMVEAMFFHELNFQENKIAMIVSYDDDSAKNINDMSDRYYQYLPPEIKPMRRPSRGKGILFENPDYDDRIAHTLDDGDPRKPTGLQSKFLIDTARNKNAGSSFTINYLHVSELSKWSDAKQTLTSLLQAVPQYNSIVVIESTANGIEQFYRLWQQAKAKELNYKTIFVGWHEHEQYSLDLTPQEEEAWLTYIRHKQKANGGNDGEENRENNIESEKQNEDVQLV